MDGVQVGVEAWVGMPLQARVYFGESLIMAAIQAFYLILNALLSSGSPLESDFV